MKKNKLVLAVVLSGCLLLSSCIGSFSLTSKLHSWNKNVGNKFVNELVFLAFTIIPVYEVSLIADALVINSIEFWSGNNPVASNLKKIEGKNGEYLVKADKKGYSITDPIAKKTLRLNYDDSDKSWNAVVNGESIKILSYIDNDHIKMYMPNGKDQIIELSQEGVLAYKNNIQNTLFTAFK